MKNFGKFALALTLIGGVSATALTIDNASARGWGNDGGYSGEQWGGKRGHHGKMGHKGKRAGAMKMFKQFDADKDGALTKDEITKGIESKISDNDKDGDGAVSLEEFKAEWAKLTQDRMVRAYQKMDRDGNGKVTAEELKEPALDMFERMDRNDDGKIDKDDRKRRGWFGKNRGNDQAPAAQAQPQSAPLAPATDTEGEIKS